MPRKTIEVVTILDWVNGRLATPDSTLHECIANLTPQQAFRLGAASLLEQILRYTGTFAGFEFHADDETRRVYFPPKTPRREHKHRWGRSVFIAGTEVRHCEKDYPAAQAKTQTDKWVRITDRRHGG